LLLAALVAARCGLQPPTIANRVPIQDAYPFIKYSQLPTILQSISASDFGVQFVQKIEARKVSRDMVNKRANS
jgi:hypothetical protein